MITLRRTEIWMSFCRSLGNYLGSNCGICNELIYLSNEGIRNNTCIKSTFDTNYFLCFISPMTSHGGCKDVHNKYYLKKIELMKEIFPDMEEKIWASKCRLAIICLRDDEHCGVTLWLAIKEPWLLKLTVFISSIHAEWLRHVVWQLWERRWTWYEGFRFRGLPHKYLHSLHL